MLFNNQKRVSLKDVLEKGPVMIPNVFDCVSAKVMEMIGFEALNLPCDNVAASLIGMPSLGMLDFDELLTVVDHIYNMSPLPLMVDINCGFGNEINVMRSCERMAKAGASAIVLNDGFFQPSIYSNTVMVDRKEFLTKLCAAKHVLADSNCMVIAKTSAYMNNGIEEAVERCKMAYEAGADATIAEGIFNRQDLEKVANVPGHKVYEMREKKVLNYEDAVDLGFDMITMEFAMAGANEYMMEYGIKSKEDMSDIFAVEHSILPNGEQMTALGNHEMFGANNWLKLGASFSDHSTLKFAGAFLPKQK